MRESCIRMQLWLFHEIDFFFTKSPNVNSNLQSVHLIYPYNDERYLGKV